jgi:hypothetical protein
MQDAPFTAGNETKTELLKLCTTIETKEQRKNNHATALLATIPCQEVMGVFRNVSFSLSQMQLEALVLNAP